MKTYELDLAIVEGKIVDNNFNSVMLDTDSPDPGGIQPQSALKEKHCDAGGAEKQRLILRLPDSATRNLFISHLESNNVSLDELNVTLEVDNVATIKDLVRRDFGVSILQEVPLPENCARER